MPTTPDAPLRRPTASLNSASSRPLISDDEEARIAREEIPGYAGSVIERDGTRTIMLADTSNLSEKLARARARFDADRGYPIGRVRRVTHSFDQLKRTRDLIVARGLGSTRWSLFDVDERVNRVVVGVADESQVGVARQAIRDMGIAESMVDIEVVPPVLYEDQVTPAACPITGCVEEPPPAPQTCTGLTCPQTTVVGGLEIGYATASRPHCTLSAIAKVNGIVGFLTASHCGKGYLGVNENTQFLQGIGSGTVIGKEYVDPMFKPTAGCYAGYVCRYSDALWAMWTIGLNSPAAGAGYIAGTAFTNWADPNAARIIQTLYGYRVTSQRQGYVSPPIPVGSIVRKVGIATGTTDGQVTRSCFLQNYVGYYTHTGLPIAFECQVEVVPGFGYPSWVKIAEQGDSGAPVFTTPNGGASTDVQFEGILAFVRSGTDASGNRIVLGYGYSSLGGIQADFGVGATVVVTP